MLSTGLVGTWVYHIYDKTQFTRQRNEIFVKDSTAVAQGVQDSLTRIYSRTINSLDARLDSAQATAGALQGELGNKLFEINRLRGEITAILKRNDVKKEDLAVARQKAVELQQLVDNLRNQNTSVEEEKKQIAGMLDHANEQLRTLETTNQQLDRENKQLTEKVNIASAFVASELHLSPVMVKNDKEQETNQASKTSKFVVSFALQNNVADYSNAEVFVVINRPDGELLTSDAWESASTMDTKSEGKKRYTRKIKFDYAHNETKRLSFSINADEYPKGPYLVQLYHNGMMIGQTNRVLN